MKKVFLLLLLSLLGNVFSHAQYLYGLDPVFANNGIYIGDTGGVKKMVVQPDGKIVIAGGEVAFRWATTAMRFNSDGNIDNSFAANGRFFSPVNDWYGAPRINSLLLQPDGKIVLGGTMDTGVMSDDFFIMRLHPDGSLDNSFGGGGYVITGYKGAFGPGAKEEISSLALQPDGKIVAYGVFDFLQDTLQLIRYHTNGRVDSNFGNYGRVMLAEGFDYPTPNYVAVMPDGRILVGGYANMDALNGTKAIIAMRLLPDGSFDTSFNHTGIAYTNNNLPGLLYCTAMCLLPDGKVVLGAYADSLAVVRFDSSGQLDNSFGTNGLVKLDPAGKVRDMLLQPDGKIVVATDPDAASIYYDSCYTIYRITSDGKIDTGFGKEGRLLTRVTNESNIITSLALQPDGKLLAGGSNWPQWTRWTHILLTRYTPDASTFAASIDLDGDITFYPNPAADCIYIDHSLHYTIQQFSLYSTDGKLIVTQTFPNTNRLSTEGMPNGIYYLRLSLSNHQQLTKKIVIQKN